VQLEKAGVAVTVCGRGEHLAAISQKGLVLKTDEGESHAKPEILNTAKHKDFQLVAVCTKMFDLENVLTNIAHLSKKCPVVGFQNGVDGYDVIATKTDQPLRGTAHISASIEEAGVVRLHGKLARFFIAPSPIATGLAQKLPSHIKVAENITQMMWDKFIFLTAFSGATALFKKPIGDIVNDKPLWSFYSQAMRESWLVAKKQAPTQDLEASLEKWLTASKKMPHQYKASMALDLERGKPLELKWLSGKVVELGKKHSIPTPCSELICSVLCQAK